MTMRSVSRKFSFLTFVLFAATGLAMLLLSSPESFGAGRRPSAKKTATPIPVDTNDRVTAVHLTSITVTIGATHQSKEFKVLPATRITVNGQPAQLSGVAVGMDVNVTPAANDQTTAAAIDAKSSKH